MVTDYALDIIEPRCQDFPVAPAFRCIHGRIIASCFELENNLSLGYYESMSKASQAARELAKLSIAARRRKWGAEGFREKMQAWGRLGGRPRTKKGNRYGN